MIFVIGSSNTARSWENRNHRQIGLCRCDLKESPREVIEGNQGKIYIGMNALINYIKKYYLPI